MCGGVIIVIYRLVAGTSRSCVGVISYLPFSGSNITLCVDVIIDIYRLVAVTSRSCVGVIIIVIYSLVAVTSHCVVM